MIITRPHSAFASFTLCSSNGFDLCLHLIITGDNLPPPQRAKNKQKKQQKIQIQSHNIVSPAFTRTGEEDTERPACVNSQRGALFPLCRPRGGRAGWGGVEEGNWCRGGLLWSKLYLRLKLKTALSTQLEPDISHLPLLGWKSMWWGILQPPPPSFSSASLSLPSLPPSLFLHLFLSADSQHVHWHKCSFFFAFVFCSHAPLGITPSEVSLSGPPQTNLHYMYASICTHSHTRIKHACNYQLQHHCRTMLLHVCRTVKLQDMCGSSRGLITFCRGRSVCLTKAINTDPWAAINLEHSCMSHTNKPRMLPNHPMWLKCGFTSLVFLSSLIKFPLSFRAAAFNANSPPFPLSLCHIGLDSQPLFPHHYLLS